jgi:hypothetical protein
MGVLTITRISLKRWLHLYIKDLGLNSWEMGVLTITRIPLKRWLHLYFKDLGLNSWEMGVLTITRIHLKGGEKQEMVAPVYQGSGVKLLGDGSSHHYKDPFKRGKEAIDGCACISRIWG